MPSNSEVRNQSAPLGSTSGSAGKLYSELAYSDVLIECSQRLHSSLDVPAVLNSLADEICDLLKARLCAVFLRHDSDPKIFELQALATRDGDLANFFRSFCVSPSHMPMFIDLCERASAAKTPLYIDCGAESQISPISAGLLAGAAGSSQVLISRIAAQNGRIILFVCPGQTAPAWGNEQRSLLSLLSSIGSLAIQNAEVHSRIRAEAEEFRGLLDICSELGSSADLDRFMETFVIRAAHFLGFTRSFIALIEGNDCIVRFGSDSRSGQHMQMAWESDISLQIIRAKQPFHTEEAHNLPGVNQELVQKFNVHQYLGVPIYAAEQNVQGILGLLDREDGKPITEEIVRRAQLLAAEVAVALQSAQNLHSSEQHRRRAESLVRMALELGGSVSLPEQIRIFASRAAEMLSARAYAMALAHGPRMETVLLHDPRLEASREHQQMISAILTDHAETAPDSLFHCPISEMNGKGIEETLGWKNVTLCRLTGTGGELLGVLCLADTPSVTADDLQTLQAIAGHASAAIENSRLFSRIEHSIRQWAEIFDSLTDYMVVHDEQHRITRVNRPLAEAVGLRPAELVGVHMRDLLAKGSGAGLQPCPFCSMGKDEFVHPILERSYLISTSRAHGALNEGMQTIHVLHDVTERRQAQQRYRELFDNIQEGAFFSSVEGRFIEVNDALVRMLGYESREELLNIDIATQFYSTPGQRNEVMRLTDLGEMSNKEVSLRKKNGALMNAIENTIAVRDARGRVIQYRGLFLDITETKRFQLQLQRERDFNTQILNNTQSFILVADTAGLISYANRRCFQHGDFDQKSLLGHPLLSIIAAQDRAAWQQAFDHVLTGRTASLELQVCRQTGSLARFSINMSPMKAGADEVTSVVIVMTDVTDAATMQAKLMHTEKMAAVGQLVSGVAHEVNNPLTAILGFADLMLMNPELPSTMHKDLQVIMHEAERTKEIVQNLLSFARQTPFRREAVDVNAVLRKTIALRAYDFGNHGVQVLEHMDEKLPMVNGDPHQLQQVFLNILNNAYDAVRETGRPGEIQIHTRRVNEHVEIILADNGPGIRHPERIFDPFFTTKEVGKGTGLGLSICYGIVKEHQGEITCRNNRSRPGAVFSVRLPHAAIMTTKGAHA